MAIIDSLMQFFGIDNLTEVTTFAEFVPWFVKLLLAVVIICCMFRCLFNATWKISRGLNQ